VLSRHVISSMRFVDGGAGTLMPFAGSNSVYGGYFGTAYGETLREQVNTWIRTSGAFDGVIDFSTLMQDPYDP
jgi:hypothetical protein